MLIIIKIYKNNNNLHTFIKMNNDSENNLSQNMQQIVESSCPNSQPESANISSKKTEPISSSSLVRPIVSRSDFLNIMAYRKNKREAAKAREEYEKKKVMDRWVAEERKAQKEKLKGFLERLSSKKTSVSDPEELRKSIDARIETHMEKAQRIKKEKIETRKCKSPKNIHEEYSVKKLDRQESENRKTRYEYEQKVKRMENIFTNRRYLSNVRMQIHKENREKRTLRAKVHTLLEKESAIICDKFRRDTGRFSEVLEKFDDNKKLRNSSSLPNLIPDEVLLENLQENELKQIYEDQNYFIPSESHRERITLFNNADPKNEKLVYNLSTIE